VGRDLGRAVDGEGGPDDLHLARRARICRLAWAGVTPRPWASWRSAF
jgi:hypothetical protein